MDKAWAERVGGSREGQVNSRVVDARRPAALCVHRPIGILAGSRGKAPSFDQAGENPRDRTSSARPLGLSELSESGTRVPDTSGGAVTTGRAGGGRVVSPRRQVAGQDARGGLRGVGLAGSRPRMRGPGVQRTTVPALLRAHTLRLGDTGVHVLAALRVLPFSKPSR